MKLYYVHTNGYDMIVGQRGDETRCFQYDDSLTDKIVAYLQGEEQEEAAIEVLNLIDPDCFDDWDGEDGDGNPYTLEDLTNDCEIIAEIEIDK